MSKKHKWTLSINSFYEDVEGQNTSSEDDNIVNISTSKISKGNMTCFQVQKAFIEDLKKDFKSLVKK